MSLLCILNDKTYYKVGLGPVILLFNYVVSEDWVLFLMYLNMILSFSNDLNMFYIDMFSSCLTFKDILKSFVMTFCWLKPAILSVKSILSVLSTMLTRIQRISELVRFC